MMLYLSYKNQTVRALLKITVLLSFKTCGWNKKSEALHDSLISISETAWGRGFYEC